MLGYGVDKMAYSYKRKVFGVCGNFRFKIYTITDAQNTRNIVKTDMNKVDFVASTNTTDNADNFKAQTLSWTNTAQADVENKIDMNATATFDPALTGLQVHNTTDNLTSTIEYSLADTDHLWGIDNDVQGGTGASGEGGVTAVLFDICPDGNEEFRIHSERLIILDPVSNDDDGTLMVIGR